MGKQKIKKHAGNEGEKKSSAINNVSKKLEPSPWEIERRKMRQTQNRRKAKERMERKEKGNVKRKKGTDERNFYWRRGGGREEGERRENGNAEQERGREEE